MSLSDFATQALLNSFCLFVFIFFLNNTLFNLIIFFHFLLSATFPTYPTSYSLSPSQKEIRNQTESKQTKKQQQIGKENHKKHGIPFFVGQRLLSMSLAWSMVAIPGIKTLKENWFCFYSRCQLQIACKWGTGCPPPFSVLELHLSWTQVLYMPPQSLQVLLCLKRPVSLESTTSGFHNLSNSSFS